MRTLILLLITAISIGLNAQEWEVPEDVTYTNQADYEAQNENVVAATNYLIETPVNKIPYKRKATNKFLMDWVTGTPTVTLTLSQEVVPFMECGECLMVYMASYAKQSIMHRGGNGKIWNYAAVKDVMNFYQNNKAAVGKNKPLEKFIKLEAKGKLEGKIMAATGN